MKYSKWHAYQFPLSSPIDDTNNNSNHNFPLSNIKTNFSHTTFHQFDPRTIFDQWVLEPRKITFEISKYRIDFHPSAHCNQLSILFSFPIIRETMDNPSTIFPAIIPSSVPDIPEARKLSPPTRSKETTNWPARRNLINGSGAIKIERATPPSPPDGARLLTRNSRAHPSFSPFLVNFKC